jgi:nucleoid DNA-binding protein
MAAVKAKKTVKAKKIVAKVLVKASKKSPVKASVQKKAKVTTSAKAKTVAAKPSKNAALAVKEPFNRPALMNAFVEHTGLDKKQVVSFFEVLKDIIVAHLSKKGPGKFKLPGLFTMRLKDKPATKARQGINPFTGQEMIFAAKPASKTVKATVMKKLKEAI